MSAARAPSPSTTTVASTYLPKLSTGFAWQIWARALSAARTKKIIGEEPLRVGLALLAHWSSLPKGVFVAHQKIAETLGMTAKKVGEALLDLERAGLVGKAVGGRRDRKGELQTTYLFRIDPNDLGADDRAKAEKWIDADAPPVRLAPPIKSRERPASSSPSGGNETPSRGNEVSEITHAGADASSPSGGIDFPLRGESDQPHEFPSQGKDLSFSAGKSIHYDETSMSDASPSGGTYKRDIKDGIVKGEESGVAAKTKGRPAVAHGLLPAVADPSSDVAGETPLGAKREELVAGPISAGSQALAAAFTLPASSEITTECSNIAQAADASFAEMVSLLKDIRGQQIDDAAMASAWASWRSRSPELRAAAISAMRDQAAVDVLAGRLLTSGPVTSAAPVDAGDDMASAVDALIAKIGIPVAQPAVTPQAEAAVDQAAEAVTETIETEPANDVTNGELLAEVVKPEQCVPADLVGEIVITSEVGGDIPTFSEIDTSAIAGELLDLTPAPADVLPAPVELPAVDSRAELKEAHGIVPANDPVITILVQTFKVLANDDPNHAMFANTEPNSETVQLIMMLTGLDGSIDEITKKAIVALKIAKDELSAPPPRRGRKAAAAGTTAASTKQKIVSRRPV